MPEAAPRGQGEPRWRDVTASVGNMSGRTVALNTLRNYLPKQRTAFAAYDNLTTKSGAPEEVQQVMEAWREYEDQLKERHVPFPSSSFSLLSVFSLPLF